MSSLVSIHTLMTRDNSFFGKYRTTDKTYGNTLQKLMTSDAIGTKAEGKLTAPRNFHIRPYLPPKIPLGGRGQSNAVQRVVYH